jgi:hypothetical protein
VELIEMNIYSCCGVVKTKAQLVNMFNSSGYDRSGLNNEPVVLKNRCDYRGCHRVADVRNAGAQFVE